MNTASSLMTWAVVVALLVLLLSSPQHLQVHAAEVTSADGFTLLTGRSRDPRASGGQELVYVVDHRSAMLLVYGLQHNGTALQPVLLDGGSISALFSQPAAPTTPPPTSP